MRCWTCSWGRVCRSRGWGRMFKTSAGAGEVAGLERPLWFDHEAEVPPLGLSWPTKMLSRYPISSVCSDSVSAQQSWPGQPQQCSSPSSPTCQAACSSYLSFSITTRPPVIPRGRSVSGASLPRVPGHSVRWDGGCEGLLHFTLDLSPSQHTKQCHLDFSKQLVFPHSFPQPCGTRSCHWLSPRIRLISFLLPQYIYFKMPAKYLSIVQEKDCVEEQVLNISEAGLFYKVVGK